MTMEPIIYFRLYVRKLNSPCWTRTNDTAVNSRMLYRLSYGGSFLSSTCTFKTAYTQHPCFLLFRDRPLCLSLSLRSNPRPISNSQLHTLLHFHLCPIYLVVFKGSYFFRMGYLILRGASRLDAFSVYPFRTWLPCHAAGTATGTPAVRPSRSSRTKDSSSQISYAHAG